MTGRAVVLRGDARALPLPDESVDLICTSPPYFALRSYSDGGEHYAGQIGAEATPAEYIAALMECTREWMRVLKPTGSLFVDLGDKYSTGNSGESRMAELGQRYRGGGHSEARARSASVVGMQPKSLIGLPWRYALGCVDQLGLILRAEIVWSKPNGLPESVTDRVRRSHEQWFHLTRRPRYYSAVDEIREPHTGNSHPAGKRAAVTSWESGNGLRHRTGRTDLEMFNPLGKLPGSVWEIPSEPLRVPAHLGVDHFAAFPTEWPRRIITGWSPPGICVECGEGRRPVASAVGLDMTRPQARRAHELAQRAALTEAHLSALLSVGVSDTGRGAATQTGTGKNTAEVYALAAEARTVLGGYAREYLLRRPTRFVYACACPQPTAPTRPTVVVDPFGGTGTTALVASVLGRIGITVDRSADYCRLAAWRTSDAGERARAMRVAKPPAQSNGQTSLFDHTPEVVK